MRRGRPHTQKQGDYAQAESVAARSNFWAGGDERLRAENWRLIAAARSARGDAAGTGAALERAGRTGRGPALVA